MILWFGVFRREALRRWKGKRGLRATYGNLLELFVKAGHTQCAEAVCEVIRRKCESITLTMKANVKCVFIMQIPQHVCPVHPKHLQASATVLITMHPCGC